MIGPHSIDELRTAIRTQAAGNFPTFANLTVGVANRVPQGEL
jgi:hypothetical protein